MNTINERSAPLFVLLAFIVHSPVLAVQVTSPSAVGEGPWPTNSVCPVTPEEAIEQSFFTEHNGSRVYFCCRRCLLRFEQAPEAYTEALARIMPVSLQREPSEAPPRGHQEHPEEVQLDSGLADNDAAADPHLHDEGHDHATDHGVSLKRLVGRLHVVVIHFPIAFLLLGACIEVAGIVRKKWVSHSVVRFLTAAGAISAGVAMVLGLLHGSATDYIGTLSWVFWWHRALGIAVVVASVITCLAVERRARRHKADHFATISLILTAALVGVAGHFGGSLVYGWEYLLP